MARMTQIHIDASRLQGVDLSQVLNKKIPLQRIARNKLSSLQAKITKAAISVGALTSPEGQWAAIPQDFESGSLRASLVMPPSTAGAAPRIVTPSTLAVTFGVNFVHLVGLAASGGIYVHQHPDEFGLTGSFGAAGSISSGVSFPFDVFLVDGPASLLDGSTLVIVGILGAGKIVFAGAGVLVSLSSWKIIGSVVEAGGGPALGPPVNINVSWVWVAGHVKIL